MKALPAWSTDRATRDAVHRYAQVLGSLRKELAAPHPRWWHISLEVADDGLATGPIAAPGAGGHPAARLLLDLERHRLVGEAGGEPIAPLDLASGPSSLELAARLRATLAAAGVALDERYAERARAEGERYDPAAAAALRRSLAAVRDVLAACRAGLGGELSPLQLWPHHFDLSFERFGRRLVEHREGDELRTSPAQIGSGFSTGDAGHLEPYFYCNPWPFAEDFAAAELPAGARWNRQGWQGALLPYAAAVDQAGLATRFFERVFEVALPSLD